MYQIAPTPAVLPRELTDRALLVEPATLGHAVDRGFTTGIHAVTRANRFAGTALTVRLAPMDGTALHHAADEVQPGHVVVIDMGEDRDRASVGAMVAFVIALRGAAGVVVDGMATDIAELEATGMPVFSRGLSSKTTRLLGLGGDVNLPVAVSGETVRPGDLVIADANGIVFISPHRFENLYQDCIDFQTVEEPARKELSQGVRLSDKFGAAEHIKRSATFLS
ncbi:RraA family protein [Arthrobacter sp. SD76]|uniref:RraA family protein n=1 Tax=Arthrobacter sp. SD76 TaxID=3415007 RepID=UPI003C74FA32